MIGDTTNEYRFFVGKPLESTHFEIRANGRIRVSLVSEECCRRRKLFRMYSVRDLVNSSA
jgi:hypothetical protein